MKGLREEELRIPDPRDRGSPLVQNPTFHFDTWLSVRQPDMKPGVLKPG